MGKMYQKLTLCGGEGRREWDDDVPFIFHILSFLNRKFYVAFDRVIVVDLGLSIDLEYPKVNQKKKKFYFIIEYPDEHITAVEGSYNKVALIATEVITQGRIHLTSKGRTSPTFGPNLFGVVNGTSSSLRTRERRS
ncbi:unnamed protein product [Brassica oleracea]